jgi:hypothetical protein
MRRLLHAVIDLVDGILAGLIYGGQGGLTYTTTTLEAQNADKMRAWSAGEGGTPGTEDEREGESTDLEERIRRFRGETRPPLG